MDYFFSLKDTHGYVHSFDNCIITYYIQDIGLKSVDRMIDKLRSLKDRYPEINYWEKLGVGACSKYHFYQNMIHLDDGITVFVGHYTDFDRDKKEAYIFPMLKLKINPNKHAQKSVFLKLMEIIRSDCYDAVLNSYDYAIDIPVPLDDVQVFGSNKERGLYKGTRYFGQRDKNGYCRIYDKGKEQNLDVSLTRVEHVISLTKSTKSISFEKIHIKSGGAVVQEKLGKTDAVIVDLCTLCAANGLEYESILDGLDRRKKKSIISQLSGNGYELLEFDDKIHGELLDYYKKFFTIKESDSELEVDEDGFLKLENYESGLPFD